jgi:hypothetical protein
MPRNRGVLRAGDGLVVASGRTLQQQLQALNPLTYVTLRGASPGAITDLGTAAMTYTNGTAITFNSATANGPDGNYVLTISGGGGKIRGTDHADLSPQAGAGLTVVCLAKPTASTINQQVLVSKAGDGSTDEWYIGTGFNQAEGDEISAGLVGGGVNYFTRLRETNTDAFPTTAWRLIIARYGTTTT